MTQTTLDPSIQAKIQGDVTGTVTVGNIVVQIGAVYGGGGQYQYSGPADYSSQV